MILFASILRMSDKLFTISTSSVITNELVVNLNYIAFESASVVKLCTLMFNEFPTELYAIK